MIVLLIFCLDTMFIAISVVLKLHTVIVLFSISTFMPINICFIYLGDPVLGVYLLMSLISSSCIEHYIMLLFCLLF